MKKLGYFLIVLFSFFIASREVSARVPDECNSYTVVRFNADLNKSMGNLDTVCSYRPLGVTSNTLSDAQGINYVNIYHVNNSNGDIYYFVGVSEYRSRRDLEMLACAVKKTDGTKETHTGLFDWSSAGTPTFDDDTFSGLYPYYSDELSGSQLTANWPDSQNNGADSNLYEMVDGFAGTTGLSYSGHDNKHMCPAYAGKVTITDSMYGDFSTFAYLTKDYDNSSQFPSVTDDGTATMNYAGALTWSETSYFSDSVDTTTGQITDMTTVSQTNYLRSHTNNTLSAAVSNSEVINDWDSCNQYGVLKTLDIVHTALLILRIMVPLVLIILGTIDFGKAGISGDDDLVTKATKTIIRRAILGVVIFFIPTLMYAFANLAGDRNNSESSDFYKCTSCFTGKQDCDSYLQTAEGKVETN